MVKKGKLKMFNIGDFVFDTIKNNRVQILDKYEIWGYTSYKVYNSSDNKIYKLPLEQVGKLENENKNLNIDYLRYVVLLAKIKNEIATGIISNLSSEIIPLPHQIHVLNRVVSSNNMRYILADEVGLGKTIEAGLIIKELKARGLVKRILIVCPKGLVTQWSLEMREKFNEKFHTILPEDYDTIKKITDSEDVYGQFDQIISPMDSIKPLEKRIGWTGERIQEYNEERIYSIINSGWDLIIIDEAHRVAGSSGHVARHKLGKLLAAASPYLLLLTATPHNGKTEPFLRLIRLIDREAFPNFKAIVRDQVAPYIIRTEKREAIDNNGNKLFKNRQTQVVEVNWDNRHTMQRELYKLTSDYVSRVYNKAMRTKGKNMGLVFLLIMMQRLVTSSTRAIRQSLERRINVLREQSFKIANMTEDEFIEMELEDNIEEFTKVTSLNIKEEIESLSQIITIARQAEFQYLDAKVEPFIDIIDNLFSNNKNQKIIVFTEFVATQDYLSNLLKNHGYTTSLLNGSMGIDQRNLVIDNFKTKTNILISTDAGGEGLNLQFSNVVINFDLPWNPMKIEQRIGRVDRIGQEKDVVIYNFILAETVEKRVKDVLEEKLSVILKEVGIDKYSDVLDSEFSELNFTNAYMKSISNPKNLEYHLRPVEKDLKIQVKNVNRFKDIINEDKDLTALIGAGPNFDLGFALQQMIKYYKNHKGLPYIPICNLSINDSQIVEHLNKDIEFLEGDSILSINIHDLPNESGYFVLWEISLVDKPRAKRIIPIFINDNLILRPLAGEKIWEELVSPTSKIDVKDRIKIDNHKFNQIKEISSEFAYDIFLHIKSDFEKDNEETYQKYLYAIDLRVEAADNIGIENIRLHKLKSLAEERNKIKKKYESAKLIYPQFKPIFLAYLEG